MVTVLVKEDEHIDQGRALEKALRRFRKELDKEGVLKEVQNRQYYVKPSMVKHIQKVKAEHKNKLKAKLDAKALSFSSKVDSGR